MFTREELVGMSNHCQTQREVDLIQSHFEALLKVEELNGELNYWANR